MNSLTVRELKEILEGYDDNLAVSVIVPSSPTSNFLCSLKGALGDLEGDGYNLTEQAIDDIVDLAKEVMDEEGVLSGGLVSVKSHQSGSARRKVVLEGAP